MDIINKISERGLAIRNKKRKGKHDMRPTLIVTDRHWLHLKDLLPRLPHFSDLFLPTLQRFTEVLKRPCASAPLGVSQMMQMMPKFPDFETNAEVTRRELSHSAGGDSTSNLSRRRMGT